MKLTAKQFNNNPAAAFRAADKGEVVTITHDRFDTDFVLASIEEVDKFMDDDEKPIEHFAEEV